MLKHLFNIVDESDIDEMVFTMNRIFGTSTVKSSDHDLTPFINTQLLNVLDEVDELIEAIDVYYVRKYMNAHNVTYGEIQESVPDELIWVQSKIVNDQLNMDLDDSEIFDALGDILTFALGGLYIMDHLYLPEMEIDVDGDLMSLYEEALNYRTRLVEFEESHEFDHSLLSSYFVEIANMAIKWSESLDYDIVSLMKAVTKSNFTKLIFTNEQKYATEKLYRDLGVEHLYFRDFTQNVAGEDISYSVIYSGADQEDKNGKKYRKDKFLKCIEFKAPVI